MGETVVVVDDDEGVREAMVDVLADEGYAVLMARDGDEALPLLQSAPRPCMALVDLVMPNVDGWELLRTIAAVPELRDIPLVCTTAGRDDIPPGVAVLRKPFDEQTLLAAVRGAFARGPRRATD